MPILGGTLDNIVDDGIVANTTESISKSDLMANPCWLHNNYI